MKHVVLLLLMTMMISTMPDNMCFQDSYGGSFARIVLNRTETDTKRSCLVACGDETDCKSVSYVEPTCLMLGAPVNTKKCSNPDATISMKMTAGCKAPTNITEGFGKSDPCIAQLYPDELKLDKNGICPRNDNKFIIRAIDEFGVRITFDNDLGNMMTFDATRNMWKFYVASTGYTKWVVAASCATAVDACCDPLPTFYPVPGGSSQARKFENGACYNSPSPTLLQFVGGKKYDWVPKTFSAADSAQQTITCQAGIWLLTDLNNSNGWWITNASCIP